VELSEGKAERTARGPGQADQQPHPLRNQVRGGKLGDDLEDAAAGAGQAVGDHVQLALGGIEARGRLAVGRLVVDAPGRREPKRAGFYCLLRQVPHLRHVRLGGRLAGHPALAHHVHPQRGVRKLGGQVHVEAAGGEEVQVFGEGLPRPGEPLGHDDLRDVLDALHQPHQAVTGPGTARRETHTAVAHDHGGDAVP
jgi:hypothetical protein